MAYCTYANVQGRLPALQDEGTDSVIDQRVADGIASADGQINGRLRKFGITVPLTAPIDPLIVAISSALAAADTIDGGFSGGGEDQPMPLSERLRAWAERQLDLICSGELVLEGINEELAAGEDGTVYIPARHSHPEQTQELDCFDVMGPDYGSTYTY